MEAEVSLKVKPDQRAYAKKGRKGHEFFKGDSKPSELNKLEKMAFQQEKVK